MDLTKEEQEELLKLTQSFAVDEKTKATATALFSDFKKRSKINMLSAEKLQACLKSAIYVAARSQSMTNLKGETIQGIGLPINQLIKANSNLDEFIYYIKQILNYNVINSETQQELKTMVDQFQFMQMFFNKFEKIFQFLDFEENTPQQKEYSKNLKQFLWILFVHSYVFILSKKQEIIEATCLLSSILNTVIAQISNYANSRCVQSGTSGLERNSEEYQQRLQEMVIKYFNIKDMATLNGLNQSLQDTIEKYIKEGVIKNSKPSAEADYLSPQMIVQNYKKLELSYQKQLTADEIDLRFFLKDRNYGYTPCKFSPFTRQPIVGKAPVVVDKSANESKNPNKTFHSHRFLNYEFNDNISIKSNLCEIKFPTNMVTSPYAIKSVSNMKPPETPMSNAMEMYNWLYDKEQKSKTSAQSNSNSKQGHKVRQQIEQLIEKVVCYERCEQQAEVSPSEQKVKDNRRNLILGLYNKTMESYYEENKNQNLEQIIQAEYLHKGFLACVCESVYFILNISKVQFIKIINIIQIPWYELWSVMDFYLKFDSTMPVSLKSHILDLEQKIVSFYAWKPDSTLISFIKSYMQEQNAGLASEKNQTAQLHERFFRRVLHQAAFQIYQMQQQLNLPDKISEGVWSCLKHIISNETDLLMNRHLDQLILSSVYSVSKVFQQQLKFQEIIGKYEQLWGNQKLLVKDIIYNVYINEQQSGDIIMFYNLVYIVEMKQFIISYSKSKNLARPQSPASKNPLIPQPILQSPLKSMIPPGMYNLRQSLGKLPPHMTPQTQMLYAYTESPLLKTDNQAVAFKNINSKKMLNFELDINQKENLMKAQLKHSQPQIEKIMENYNGGLQETNDFINKKFSNAKGKNLFASNNPIAGNAQAMLDPQNIAANTPKIMQNFINQQASNPSNFLKQYFNANANTSNSNANACNPSANSDFANSQIIQQSQPSESKKQQQFKINFDKFEKQGSQLKAIKQNIPSSFVNKL